MPCTVVAFNAHPDDEALLMGGTLAALAARGHRVVLVTATDGAEGLAGDDYAAGEALGTVRMSELAASAQALGAARVVPLGYADSGSDGPVPDDPPGKRRFVRVQVQEAATALGEVLTAEHADLLIGYDPNGGYGHRDHVHVHAVARGAAQLAGTRLVEATLPREPLLRGLRVIERVYPFPHGFSSASWQHAYTAKDQITHRIDVRPQLAAKRAAMRAHLSQTTTTQAGGARTLAAVMRLPRPLYRVVFGTEFFVDPFQPSGPVRHDLLADR